MRIRRCATLWLEPREIAHFELDDLLAGGTGVVSRLQWFAHAPQLPAPVEVVPDDVVLLGSLSPQDWVAATPLRERHGAARVRRRIIGVAVADTAEVAPSLQQGLPAGAPDQPHERVMEPLCLFRLDVFPIGQAAWPAP